jgi:hypothetical protein
MQSEQIYGTYIFFVLVGVVIGMIAGGLLGYRLGQVEADVILEDDDYSVLEQEELA